MKLVGLSIAAAIQGISEVSRELSGGNEPAYCPRVLHSRSLRGDPDHPESLILDTISVAATVFNINRVLSRHIDRPRERRAMVKIRELVAIIGEGVMIFDQAAVLLRDGGTPGEVRRSRLLLHRFRDVLRFLHVIFGIHGNMDINLSQSIEGLHLAAESIANGAGKFGRRLKAAHLLADQPDLIDRSLAEVPDLSTVRIPLAPNDLAATSYGYDFGYFDGTNNRPRFSCNAYFHRPSLTNADILQFFRDKIRAWARVDGSEVDASVRRFRHYYAKKNGPPRTDEWLRNVAADCYDELARRVAADKKKAQEFAGGPITIRLSPVEMDNLSERRNGRRVKLSGIDDQVFRDLALAYVIFELERR
ncbi:hypothetical protein B0T16DRAFT_458655 [Cercophora newfieldiana]|uniref:Uncharacterized protein n=1 Tax=Cercophora newfieldiana TaxID=92897 RepID=A0AA39Y662_9PEZI|nr:hypothetical protein B0T16DRAFT_458655 [Cercophora newfieldiana]